MICFCTAVIVEALGGIPRLDTDTVKRVLNFVFDGLNPDMRGSQDHKVCSAASHHVNYPISAFKIKITT